MKQLVRDLNLGAAFLTIVAIGSMRVNEWRCDIAMCRERLVIVAFVRRPVDVWDMRVQGCDQCGRAGWIRVPSIGPFVQRNGAI